MGVVTIVPTKEGIGNTVIATAMATALSGLGKTLLLTNNFQYKDIINYAGMQVNNNPASSINTITLMFEGETLNAQQLKMYCQGGELLFYFDSQTSTDSIEYQYQRLSVLLQMAKASFKNIVIDWKPLSEATTESELKYINNLSDEVIVVTDILNYDKVAPIKEIIENSLALSRSEKKTQRSIKVVFNNFPDDKGWTKFLKERKPDSKCTYFHQLNNLIGSLEMGLIAEHLSGLRGSTEKLQGTANLRRLQSLVEVI